MTPREGVQTRQQHQQYNPTGTYFRPQSSYNPFQGRHNPYDQNRSYYNPGGFWDRSFF